MTTQLYDVITTGNGLRLWEFSRSFVNYGLVVVLIISAFATVLRISLDTYSIKKVLPGLFTGFVLANLSLVICRTILQLCDSAVATFNSLGLSSTSTIDILTGKMYTVVTAVIGGAVLASIFGAGLGLILLAGVALLIIFFPTIAWLGILLMLVSRYYVVQYLVAFSPFFFMAMGIPFAKKWFQTWWKQFITWVTMKPLAYLLLYIGALVVNSQLGNPILAYAIGLFAMYSAVVIPFRSGGFVNATVAKLAKTVGGGAASNAYGRLMTAEFSSSTRAGRAGQALQSFVGQTAGGYTAFKQQEAVRARQAKANVQGIAQDALKTRERMASARKGRAWKDKAYWQSLNPFTTKSNRLASLGIQEVTTGRAAARVAEEAEIEKALPKDYDQLLDVYATTTNSVEKRVAHRKIAELGKTQNLAGQLEAQRAQIEKEKGVDSYEARQFSERYGLKDITQKIDYSNSNQMLLITALALTKDPNLAKQAQAAAKSAKAGEEATEALKAIATNINKDVEAVQQIADWSAKAFSAGDHHLGAATGRAGIGKPVQIEVNQKKRYENAANKLFFNEPQKTATTLNSSVMVDASGQLNEFGKEVLKDSRKGAGALKAHSTRISQEVRDASAASKSSGAPVVDLA